MFTNIFLISKLKYAWWRHQMETFSALLANCAGIHRSPVISPHKGQWRVALMFSLICVWMNGWVNNREGGELRRHCAHYDVTVIGKLTMSRPAFNHKDMILSRSTVDKNVTFIPLYGNHRSASNLDELFSYIELEERLQSHVLSDYITKRVFLLYINSNT